ncbi:MAG: HAD-IIA family hydrolase [Microthrixaceae bacterium]
MGFALDLDGVIWLADQPIPGAAEAVARLRQAGEQVLFCTNSSMDPTWAVEEKLARHGIAARGDVVTSADVAGGLLSAGERVLVCGGQGIVEAVEARGAQVITKGPADVVLVGLDRSFTYERLRIAADAVAGGARLLATNDDATYPTPTGAVPGGGAILAAIERASGAVAEVAGKPHAPMVTAVRARLGDAGVVVGDRPETDGAFARALGYRFALVLTGVVDSGEGVDPRPDVVAPDLAAVLDQLLR